jgi:hypothetical protein
MIRETYKGRKIAVVKGTGPRYGYAKLTLNGKPQGFNLGSPEEVLQSTKNWIDFVDQDPVVDGSRWGSEWYAPGTFEMCPSGFPHPMAIGGPCRHPSCTQS